MTVNIRETRQIAICHLWTNTHNSLLKKSVYLFIVYKMCCKFWNRHVSWWGLYLIKIPGFMYHIVLILWILLFTVCAIQSIVCERKNKWKNLTYFTLFILLMLNKKLIQCKQHIVRAQYLIWIFYSKWNRVSKAMVGRPPKLDCNILLP